jgi:hypothetical protein
MKKRAFAVAPTADAARPGRGLMPLFYIVDDNENDVRRCRESRSEGCQITIAGIDISGKVATFTGIVQSVAHDAIRKPGRRYSVTIL